ncbi:MAG: TerB family tellurite resistance protein [Shewanella sp.]|nr:TerB family tellurite resistance protein [Shewanella sp.]MCF1430247.1 TerB family tellurite resistance protein [Shewanella sp.]MCF1437957.1 TerB family tellurite resistance protein [Shewanella sp.]MCF1459591.1 TerB family tellurite resistance protein [Shewanella sp.]
MIAKLKQYLTTHLHAQTPEEKQRNLDLAAASMLLEVAYADDALSAKEATLLPNVMQQTLGLSAEEVSDLIAEAKGRQQQATSLYEFTNEINDAFTLEQKQKLVLAMWQLAYADGKLCQYEDQIIRRMADLLYLKHSELIQLRNRAMSMD